MKKVIFSLLLFATTYFGISQNSYLSAIVLENNSFAEIENAIVTIQGTGISTKTNINGEFSFNKKIPSGEQIITINKEGYVTEYIIINIIGGKSMSISDITINITKKEKKRRKKTIKNAEKTQKKELKELSKNEKKLKKAGPEYLILEQDYVDENKNKYITKTEEKSIDPNANIKFKYGGILSVPPSEIINMELYAFIDSWIETPYLNGGETKNGIDCSSFSQRLFISVFEAYIERTAQKQFDSINTDKFAGMEFLKEGDLVFFGTDSNNITHVGVYLDNNKFINATSRNGDTGYSGVKISNLSEPYWHNIFIAGGRRLDVKK